MFPYLRSALLATNICCPPEKIEDGIARLLEDTDVATMKAKDKLIQVTSVEKVLMESWMKIDDRVKSGHITDKRACSLFGSLSSRLVLLLTEKEKQGFEKKAYGSIANVKAKFIEDLAVAIGGKGATEDAEPKPEGEAAVSVQDVSSAKWIAQSESGIEVDNLFRERASWLVFSVSAMDDAALTLVEKIMDDANAHATKTVSYDSFRKEFVPYKGKLQAKIEIDIRAYHVDGHVGFMNDRERCKIFEAIMDLLNHMASLSWISRSTT